MNEATIKITGMERELLTGSDFFDYFTEPQPEKYIRKFSQKDQLLTLRLPFAISGKLTDVPSTDQFIKMIKEMYLVLL
jgi:hypothetical protein